MSIRRYRIEHRTRLSYVKPVTASHNELRMSPQTEPGQTTLESKLRVRPLTWSHVYRDYWNTAVTAVEAQGAHADLEIESISTVERTTLHPTHHALTWDDLCSETLKDTHFEWLTPTPRTNLSPAVLSIFRERAKGLSPADAVAEVLAITSQRIDYQTGVTEVHSSAQDAWDAEKGVCQDFSHLALGGLRALEIPCRYVSGYLVPLEHLAVGQSAIGESHAWIEWWDGEWIPADPTNLRPVDLDHVVVARGRDYEDVPPFKGVYQGAAHSAMSVEVAITRLA